MEIHSIFTKKNKLQLSIDNNHYKHGDFKICFSLVYSIQDIDGGTISKKVGRYYEIYSRQKKVTLSLQQPRVGTYNLSCGLEGSFIIGKDDKKLECKGKAQIKQDIGRSPDYRDMIFMRIFFDLRKTRSLETIWS